MLAFEAPEHRADGVIGRARYSIDGDPGSGWTVRREGRPHLELGAGYRLLRASHCGICATDLARHRLPFPLPQVTGHEVVARDDDGRLVAVEINASHAARALPRTAWCAACLAGRGTHCEDRLVLGIHGLLGGFSPWILVPVAAVVPLPDGCDPALATMLEPFAAAWHAVQTIQPGASDTVAVLGAGRLGTLVLMALEAHRRRTGAPDRIAAIVRSPSSAALAIAAGADRVWTWDDVVARGPLADVVVETTGAPEGFEVALGLARREVHLKSTTGQPACGLRHATELVVDELRLVGAGTEPAAIVATSLAEIDAAIRPGPAGARPRVRPREAIAVVPPATAIAPLLRAVRAGLRVTTSRCGDLAVALPVFLDATAHRETPRRLVRQVLPVAALARGYAAARAPQAGKIVMRHDVA